MATEDAGNAAGPVSRFSRAEKLLGGLDMANTRGVEIGALTSPLVTSPDANIRYVDHADTATLRLKYADDPNVRIDDIVNVDAVWGEQTLSHCLNGELFDYVIASHVAEHVPDLIGWFSEVAEILRPGGRLILAIPDRRYSFDVLRRETSLSELIDNHLRRARRPTPGQVFDFNANAVDFDFRSAWKQSGEHAELAHYVTKNFAFLQAKESASGVYLDVHCSVFTAASLLRLLDGLLELELLPFAVERFHVAEIGTNEMSLVMSRTSTQAPDEPRRLVRHLLNQGVDSEGLPLSIEPQKPAATRDDQVRNLERALHEIRSSTSWQLTAPLRALARFVKRPKRSP